jgi:hypothetical protein
MGGAAVVLGDDQIKGARLDQQGAVILSEAKDLMPVASGDEILRCAQDD